MAKITPGALVGEIRNALGGMVFSRNTYGPYIRNNVVPVNPASAAQETVRQLFESVAQAWRSLTAAQRVAWNSTAEASFTQTDVFGNSFQLTGFNLFVKLNLALVNVGESMLTAPPAEFSFDALGAIAVTAIEDAAMGNTLSYDIDSGAGLVQVDTKLVVEATAPLSPGVDYVENLFKKITVLDATAVFPEDILSAYEAVHGAFGAGNVGQRIAFRSKSVSLTSGQIATPKDVFATITT